MEVPSHRILMTVSNDLVTDQRVGRSCDALVDAGYSVILVGRRLPPAVPLVRRYPTVRLRLLFRKGPLFYAELNMRLFFWLLLHKGDLFYANDTDTLLACYLAARLRRKPLFFDAHELFPEVPELADRPRIQRVWQRIERHVLTRLGRSLKGAAVTVSQPIAEYYHERYGITMQVVRNLSEYRVPSTTTTVELPQGHILLYQGAVNEGRCVDWLIDAMEFLPECHLLVAGTGDCYQPLRSYAASRPWKERITFLGRIEPATLHSLTPHATLGLVLMEKKGLSYYYSFPNRISDFVMAGVPVAASDFPEINRFLSLYPVGCLIDTTVRPTPQQLAKTLQEAISRWLQTDPDERAARFEAAREELSWDKEKFILVYAVDAIFRTS